MDGCKDGRAGGRADGMDGWTSKQYLLYFLLRTYGRMDGRTDGRMDGMYGWAPGREEGWTDECRWLQIMW